MRNAPAFPLTVPGAFAGVVLGALSGVWSDNLLVGFSVFTLILTVSLVWRSGQPPVVPFILAYQWVSVTAGYWYAQLYGAFPGEYRPGDVERTMILALAGLIVLALGIRLVSELSARRETSTETPEPAPLASVWPLFAVVTAAYAIDYVYSPNAREFGGAASLIQRILEFRQVLLVTLWLEIIRSRRHVLLLVASFLWAVVPRLGTYYSDFKSPVLLMLLVLASSWRPWEARWWPRSVVAALKAAPFAGVLLVLLLVWQGGLKDDTRWAHRVGVIGADPGSRIAFFVNNARSNLPALMADPAPYVQALVERVSYITFFSRVLEQVPDREPYAGGALLKMALWNAFVPRVLVPDKPELPSDSYYTRRYAGVQVAEDDTSISIGYMAEFYADWGLAGMFTSIFLYGCWIGLIGNLVYRFTAVPLMRAGAVIVVLLAVADFEHQFIKGFAALNLNALVTLALVLVFRPYLSKLLSTGQADGMEPIAVGSTIGAGSQ